MIRETFVDGELVESVEVPDDPTPVTADPIVVLAEIGDALSTITTSSTSTALRTALLAMRTVIDNAVQS